MIGSMRLRTVFWNRVVRVVARCVAAGAILFGVAGVSCHAKEMCPWINEQTAAGFLKGDVTATVTHASTGADKAAVAAATVTGISATIGDATCEFAHRDASGGVTRLRIEVVTMGDVAAAFPAYRGRCGTSGQPVRAIGNEAEVCSMAPAGRGAGVGVGEQVVGRVRERAFVVSIAAGAGADQATLRETTLRVAEQVAGFLF
jgi:hypothetical protein